jgi:hypothetical protein
MKAVDSIRDLISRLGVRDSLLYVLMRALDRLSAGRVRLIRYLLVAQPIPERPEPSCRPSTRTRVRRIGANDPVRHAFPRPHAVIQGRFERDHVCLVATQGDVFAGFLWLAFGYYDEDEVQCRFELMDPSRCAWDYDVCIVAPFKHGRSFARMWDSANQLLAERGVRWSISRISAFNHDSLAAHRRLGLRHLKSVSFLVAGRFQLSLLPDRPYVHLGWNAATVPTIRIEPPAT